jgi:hypothetical protein
MEARQLDSIRPHLRPFHRRKTVETLQIVAIIIGVRLLYRLRQFWERPRHSQRPVPAEPTPLHPIKARVDPLQAVQELVQENPLSL